MPNLVNGDIYVCRVYCTLADQASINRVYYRIHTVIGTPTDIDLAAKLDDNFDNPMKNLLVIDASYRGVGVQRRRPLPPTLQIFATAGQGAGVIATPPLPKQVSGLISLRTLFAGRKFRGRFYVPFPSEASNESVFGRPTAAYIADLNILGAALRTPFTCGAGANTAVAVAGLFNEASGVFNDFNPAAAPVGHQPRQFWASQRRRGDYGPKNISPI